MKLTEIQDLIKFVARAGVTEVEIEQKEFKITIKSEMPKGRGKKDEAMVQDHPSACGHAASHGGGPCGGSARGGTRTSCPCSACGTRCRGSVQLD